MRTIALISILFLIVAVPGSALQDQDKQIEKLIERLGSEDFSAQGSAASQLERMGLSAIPQLKEASKHGTKQIAKWAKKILARIKPQEEKALQELVKKLGGKDFGQQGRAAEKLVKHGERALKVLNRHKDSENKQIRDWVARILKRIEGARPSPGVKGRKIQTNILEASKWLARHQNPEGFWDVEKYSNRCGRAKFFKQGNCRSKGGQEYYKVGVTGLAVMALLGAGYDVNSRDDYGDRRKP